MNYINYFKDKKITVMGLGLLGRGLKDVEFLAQCGADLIVTDLKTEKDLFSSLEKLRDFKNIKYVLGEHRLDDFRNRDFVLKGAGVPLDSPYIAEAVKNNVPVEMDASLFLKLAPKVISVGVTGTRGKTTTTILIYEILKKYFEGKKQKVFVGGNIKDVAMLPLLKEVKENDIVVMELDSWQLQGFGDSKISPHVAVFTNFLNDHLNYYKGDIERYFSDKANIFLNQKQNDYLVVGEKVGHLITAKHFGNLQNSMISVSPSGVPKDWDVKLKGGHNLENISLAIGVSKIFKIPYETIKEVVENFNGVSGRLEFVRNINGVDVYNDTTATTPDATIAGLRGLGDGKIKKIILIMGGADKSLDMSKLIEEIPRYCKTVILLAGTGTAKLKIDDLDVKIEKVDSLKEALQKAISVSETGDTVLFSPAFASFGMFKNEYDRGDKFIELVRRI